MRYLFTIRGPCLRKGVFCWPRKIRCVRTLKLVVMLAEVSAVVGTAGLAAGGYLYAGMWPTSQIFGKAIVAGRAANEFALQVRIEIADVKDDVLARVGIGGIGVREVV